LTCWLKVEKGLGGKTHFTADYGKVSGCESLGMHWDMWRQNYYTSAAIKPNSNKISKPINPKWKRCLKTTTNYLQHLLNKSIQIVKANEESQIKTNQRLLRLRAVIQFFGKMLSTRQWKGTTSGRWRVARTCRKVWIASSRRGGLAGNLSSER
jgi:hypothetical protein